MVSKLIGLTLCLASFLFLSAGVMIVLNKLKWDSSDYILVGLYCLATGATILNLKANHGKGSNQESTLPKS
jgi:hypothetical protein